MKELKYEILGSGSTGNCVVIEDMMVDIGLPYKKIKKYLYDIKYILITHRHTDHVNRNTAKRIKEEFPRIKIIGNYDVCDLIKLDYPMGDETGLAMKDRRIQSFKCVHDVPCSGYTINYKGLNLIYATDTASLEHAPKEKYDYFFIESNHDEKKVEAIRNNTYKKYGYNAYAGAKRHLSTQQSQLFYFLNRKEKESKWIELHKSRRFY